ncbi:MAG: glycosyl hydrolase 115 family protein [Lachnospiraceae bacterium]|nr:glycosyl hydrolase 115 family protein [Lachnospiraceae bacterium]
MEFIIGQNNPELKLILASDEWPGVIRIAKKVAGDIELVTGTAAKTDVMLPGVTPALKAGCIYAATLGHSSIADLLMHKAEASCIIGKRECYVFDTVDVDGGTALVIAGSDKRGTIYGLFRISELLGVSPWVWFADVVPVKKDNVILSEDSRFVSKEPSVEYRGIFINDEWPSFGNWTFEHFGGFTSEMYEHVFELILRLKGNYLWPAMWTSNFSLDGPGFSNAELADEMGIVMSNSHHEPCLRHSEEWDLVKGDDTPYGKDWNFDKNREGLTNYWRDGLIRNGKLENIITMGMRGERDSEIMGAEATLKDNIDYIKEVVEVQNRLIRETIDPDLNKVPRMIAIYKEVEKYYYGDADNPGLKEWDGLDGITCMLCEDNHGNMRGLPTDDDRDHDGGFGMYYHFDYHGGPVSYEWINSTSLKKTWEQMCEAYESGVRKIWIVNTGDLKPQELPISFFMDLAYDYDKWGISNISSADDYLKIWTQEQFNCPGSDGQVHTGEIRKLLDDYMYLNLIRKPETLRADTYHPFNYGESREILKTTRRMYEQADSLSRIYEGTPIHDAYEELVGFPVKAAANLHFMQTCAGRNMALARVGCPSANIYAGYIDECFKRDAELTDMYHSLAEGKWSGMMSSEHMSFMNWNEEESLYPLRTYVYPYRKPRMIVHLTNTDIFTTGEDWTRKTLVSTDCLDPKADTVSVTMENGGSSDLEWSVTSDREWIAFSAEKGTLKGVFDLEIKVNRSALDIPEGEADIATVTISTEVSHVDVVIPVIGNSTRKNYIPVIPEEYVQGRDHRYPGYDQLCLVIDADAYDEEHVTGDAKYVILSPFGKYGSAIKAYPVTSHFEAREDADSPHVTYNVYAPEEGDYELTLITAPSNPIDGSGRLRFGIKAGESPYMTVSMVDEGYMGGENSCAQWCRAVLDQEHRKNVTVRLHKGENSVKVHAVDPGLVLERILIRKSGTKPAPGYMGPGWRFDR